MWGKFAVIQRCQVHKQRNVKAHVPEKHHAELDRRLSGGLSGAELRDSEDVSGGDGPVAGADQPGRGVEPAGGAGGDVAGGPPGVLGGLRRTLATTNPIERALSVTRRVTARVTHWRDGDMRRRWCVAGLLRAEAKFRRVKGHQAIPAS